MTTKYFIQTKQLTETIPVIVEQSNSTILTNINGDIGYLINNADGLFNATQVHALNNRLNFGCLYFNKTAKTWNVMYNMHSFYKLFFSFRSKVKGIVKLRSLTERTIVENNKLFSAAVGGLRIEGITWSKEAATLMLQVLKEQYGRWEKVCTKYPTATVPEKLNHFIFSATGQKDIYPGDKVLLFFYLEKILPQHILLWSDFLAAIGYNKPAVVTTELYSKLYYCQLTRNKNDFFIDGLDYLFREIKKPLTNLINLFTTDPKKIKFIQCIK